MAISVHTNYANLVTQNTLQNTNNSLSKSMERLSTGFRINSASDDAAGLQIANRLETQSRGMNVAMRNSQDAISMMQTAEGSMEEMTNIAYRMNDLATQAANGTNSDSDLASLNSEFTALADQLTSIQEKTSFGGTPLLGGTGAKFAGAVTFQVGATSNETLSVDVSAALTTLGEGILALDGNGAGIDTAANATIAMTALAGANGEGGLIGTLGAARSSFGAQINNLNHTMNNLSNMSENVQASKGRIMDTDFAFESGQMSKNQMLMQSGAQMLGATKMVPQLAMSMLG